MKQIRSLLLFSLFLFSVLSCWAQSVINFNSGGNTIGCVPNTINYTISGNTNSFTNYTLNFGDGSPTQNYITATLPSSISHIYNTSSCSSSFSNNGTICPNSFGATLTGSNSNNGQQGSWVVYPIGISQPPISSYTITSTPVCTNSPITFNNTSFPGTVYTPTGSPCEATCDPTNSFYWQLTGPSLGIIQSGILGSNNAYPNDWGIWTPGSNNLVMIFATPGIYTMKLFVGNPCNTSGSVSTQTFCVVAQPQPQFSVNPNTGCFPPSFNVNATNSTVIPTNACFPTTYIYNWSVSPATGWAFNSPNTASSTNSGFTFSAVGTYTVSLAATVNNLTGCTASSTQQVTVNQAPTVNAGADFPICASAAAIQLTGSPTGGTWSGTGVNSAGLYTPPANAGNATLTYTIPAAASCPSLSDQVIITINPRPTITIAPLTPSICNGNSVSLTASSSIASSTFNWAPTSNLTPTTGATVSANPTATTTYTVTGTVPTTGCTNTASVAVTVNPRPTVTIPTPPAICVGSSATLTATGAGGLGPYTYTWTPALGLSPSTGATVSANPSVTSTFTVTVTDSRGCTGTANATVTVNPIPIVNAGSDLSICTGSAANILTGFTPTGGTWSGTGVTSTGVFTPNAVGNITLTYSVTVASCTGSDQIVINVINPTAANAGGDQGICLNAPALNLTGIPLGGSWGGNSLVTSAGVFTPSAAGTYTLTYTIGSGSCSATDQKIVTVYALPTVTVNDPTICEGAQATLTAVGAGGLSPYSYAWTPAAGLSANTGAIVTTSPGSSTSYTVTVTDAHLCAATDVSSITVNPIPIVNAGPDLSICTGSGANALNGFTPTGGTWSGTGVTSAGVFTPSVIGNVTLTYSAIVLNCTGTDQIVVNVINPTAADAGADQGICLNAPALNLTGTPSGGAWSGSALLSSAGVFTPSATGTYTLTYTYGSGSCLATDQKIVTVYSLPTVSVNNPTICVGAQVTLTATGAGGLSPYSYAWSPSSGLSSTTGSVVSTSPSSSTNYTVTITDNNTCSSSLQAAVTVNQLPIVEAGSNLSVCNTPTITQLTGNSPQNGTWTGTGVSASGGFTPTATGSFILTYTFTDSNNCINTDSLTISVTAPDNVNAGLNDSICLNSPLLQLIGSPTGGDWTGNSLVSIPGVFTPSQVGTFLLFYTVGQGSCAVTDSLVITTLALPEITGQGATICASDTAALSVSGTNGTGNYSYAWSPPNNLSSSVGSSVSAFPISNQDYSVTITDIAGCTDQLTVSILVNQLPIVNAGSDLTVCFTPISTALIGESPLGGTWSGSGVSNGEFVPTITGSQTIYYTYTEAATGCVNLDSIQITANNPDVVNAGNDTSVCVTYDTFLLTGQSPLNGQWTGDNQVTAEGDFSASQVGAVTLTYTTGTGTCAVSDVLVVTVLPLPVVEAGLDTSVCINSLPFSFSGESPTGLGTWVWSGPGIGDSQSGTFNPLTVAAGLYVSVYSFTEMATGCLNSDSLSITVNGLTPVEVASDPIEICLTPFNTILTASPIGGLWTGNDINSLFNIDAIEDTAGFVPTVNGSFQAFYTFSDANSCINADTVHIDVVSPVDADAGTDLSFCLSVANTAQLVGLPANGTWTDIQNPIWLFADGAVLLNQADTSEVIFTVGSGSCQTWDTAQVVIFPLPFISAGLDTFRCLDDPCFQLLPPNPSGGIWSGNGISNSNGLFCSQIAGEGLQNIYYEIDTVYYYQNLQSTCINKDSLEILVVPMPIPGLTIDPVLCIDVDYTLGNQSSGPASEFEWIIIEQTLNDTIFYSNASAPTINITTAGSYQLTLNSISPYGCSVSTSSNFIVVEPPVPQFAISADLACAPYLGSILNNSVGYDLTYDWSFGPLFPTSSSVNPLLPVFPSPVIGDSLFYVELSLTNLCGTRTFLDSIVIRPLPVAQITTDYSIGCSPTTIVFQNISYGSPDTFLWDFDNGTTSTDSLPAPFVFQALNFPQVVDISITVSNSCGVSVDTANVTIYPNSFNIGSILPQTACAPFNFTFQSPSTGQTFYLWDFGDGEGAIGEVVAHFYPNAGEYLVQLTVSNFCFSDTIYTILQLLEGPDLDFDLSATSICEDTEITLNNTSLNGINFNWIIDNSLSSVYSSPVNQIFSQGGNFSIGLSGENPLTGCIDTTYTPLTVWSRPIISITANPDTGCAPLLANFTNTTQNATSYEWSFSNGTGSSEAEPSLLISGIGTFTAELIAHNYQSSIIDCPDTANVTVLVNPTPTSLFSLSADAGCGPPSSVQTINQSESNLSFQWSWEGQFSSISSPQLSFVDTGLHSISLRVTNQYQCSDTSGKSYQVFGQPQVAFNLIPAEGCAPLSVDFLNLTEYGDSVLWGFGDGNFSSISNTQHVYEEPGFYSVELYVSSGNGLCSDDTLAFQAIKVHPVANSAFLVSPSVISQSEPYVALSNQSNGFNSLQFYIDTLLISEQLPTSYLFENPDSGLVRFTLVTNNEFGCSDTSFQDVMINSSPRYYFPNTFSPNQDGINDVYRGFFDRAPTYYHVTIYDRWGHRVFESFDYEEGWDGTYFNRGEKPIKCDVYVLKFSAIFEGTIKISDLYKNVNVIH